MHTIQISREKLIAAVQAGIAAAGENLPPLARRALLVYASKAKSVGGNYNNDCPWAAVFGMEPDFISVKLSTEDYADKYAFVGAFDASMPPVPKGWYRSSTTFEVIG